MTLLSAGFRPFFLLAAAHAIAAMAFWLIWLGVHLMNGAITDLSIGMPPHVWHGHEMLFGFVSAAVAGFLLTAVPNWTGTAPVAGPRLALLVAVWLAGRVAVWASAALPPVLVVLADAAFLPLLGVMLAGPLLTAGKARNAAFLLLLAVLSAALLLSQAGIYGWLDDGGYMGRLIAIDVAAVMMTVIGGRITPAFSRNWLRARGRDLPEPPRVLNLAAGLSVVLVLLSDAQASWLGDLPRGLFALLAGALLLARLVSWRGWLVRAEPLLWVLHLGALWLAVGFLLRGGALLWDWMPETTALHAHTVGAAGTLVIGVMSRATLGHTGRSLTSDPWLTGAFVLVTVAALARLVPPVAFPALYLEAMVAAGLLWCVAAGLFLLRLTPALIFPRQR